MILFLNFAPIEFMGGSEKMMLDLATYANKKEKSTIIDVSSKISNIYGELILHRKFSSHIKSHKVKSDIKLLSLSYSHFIPFSKKWFEVKKTLSKSRIIYVRFEFPEILILIYFGGIGVFKKTAAGLILNPYYASPRGLLDKIHNLIYGSAVYKYLLRSVKRVHVLNHRDENYLKKLNLDNLVYVPNGTNLRNKLEVNKKSENKLLNIIFVGELSTRKGIDIMEKIVKISPDHFIFHIIGDGPLKELCQNLSTKFKNFNLHGYVEQSKLESLYNSSDVMLFPSRAEAFGLVMIEAMSYGLKVINSKNVSLGLPSFIEYSSDSENPRLYLKLLSKVFIEKKNHAIPRRQIYNFCKDNFSTNHTNKEFVKKVLI